MIKISEFKSCRDNPPTKDGSYVVIKMRKNCWTDTKELSYGASLFYSVEHGWNVHKNSDGSWYTEAQMTFDDEPECVWAEVTEEEDDTSTT